MKRLVADPETIACCGLYCGACGAFLKGHCPGCAGNEKASWCTLRSCCQESGYRSCADCTEFTRAADCPKHDTVLAKLIGLVLNSDRGACVDLIRERGYDGFAEHMTFQGRQTIPRWPRGEP